jgi:acetyl-CoA C-acetyltransferase
MESMTRAPHLLMGSREGFKIGNVTMEDALFHDGLYCSFDKCLMGESTESYNGRYGLTREDQDQFAMHSHQRAAAATAAGVFNDEIIPMEVPQGKGATTTFAHDEGIRADTTMETLGKLRPAFSAEGTITAGSASQISDGGAAVVVMNKAKAEALGLEWLCEIGAHGVVAGPDTSLHAQPANALEKALKREGMKVSELDIVEINEAFAAVGLVSTRQLGIDPAIVNPHGGAIAVGHPVGMSGARLALHIALDLKKRGGGVGAAALCGGGGQGDALILKRA